MMLRAQLPGGRPGVGATLATGEDCDSDKTQTENVRVTKTPEARYAR